MTQPITMPETQNRVAAVVAGGIEVRRLEILGYAYVDNPAEPHQPRFRPIIADPEGGHEGITIEEYLQRHDDLKWDYVYLRRLQWSHISKEWS